MQANNVNFYKEIWGDCHWQETDFSGSVANCDYLVPSLRLETKFEKGFKLKLTPMPLLTPNQDGCFLILIFV